MAMYIMISGKTQLQGYILLTGLRLHVEYTIAICNILKVLVISVFEAIAADAQACSLLQKLIISGMCHHTRTRR